VRALIEALAQLKNLHTLLMELDSAIGFLHTDDQQQNLEQLFSIKWLRIKFKVEQRHFAQVQLPEQLQLLSACGNLDQFTVKYHHWLITDDEAAKQEAPTIIERVSETFFQLSSTSCSILVTVDNYSEQIVKYERVASK